MNLDINTLALIGTLGTQELVLILILGIMFSLFAVLPFWFICKKAGFSPWLSLLMLIPFGAIILPFILAFSPWNVSQPGSGEV